MTYRQTIGLSLGLGKAGLTDLRAKLFDVSGVDVGTAISTGFTEIGSGNYIWDYSAFPDGHRGGVKFYSLAAPTEFLASGSINPEDSITADAANKIADHVRRRTQANVEASANGDAVSVGSEYGMIQQGQNSSVTTNTLTIKKTDNTTLGTKTLATSPSASPVTGVS